MEGVLRGIFFVCCLQLAASTDPPCTIELECAECLPDNMPLVSSHRAANGSVMVPAGDELALTCGGGNFLAYPLRAVLAAVCEGGRYRVRHDNALRHLLELGCQENIFEDVLHQVEHCAAPLQGRAYQTQEAGVGARHLATVCFDADRAVAVRARVSAGPLAVPAHVDARSPLSLLGNFGHMFDARTRHDAERLYSDDARMNRRLHELFKHEGFSFAGQALTAAALLSGRYFADQDMRVADFASNKLPVWDSVARGNLRHLQRDVAELLRRARLAGGGALDVYTGTHGTLSLRAAQGRREALLKPGRFPVPRYVWAVAHDRRRSRALALVLLNDPFVAVSEVRDAVFCESACAGVAWLRALRTHRNYECPVYGLVFCCGVHNFTSLVPEMPARVVADVPAGPAGLLLDYVDQV